MLELATQIAKGEKELNKESINEMLEAQMDRAHKILKSGYDKDKAWEMFYNILQKNRKATELVMNEAMARYKGKKAWTMERYSK